MAINYLRKKSTAKHFHSHETSQLSCSTDGVLYVTIKNKLYIVPPNMAIFIPKHVPHKSEMQKEVTLSSLYLPDTHVKFFLNKIQLIQLTPLANLLILKICSLEKNYFKKIEGKRLLEVLIDELKNADTIHYAEIIIPEDRKLFRAYELFREIKEGWPSNHEVAEHLHVSTRTLLRLFKKETGMSFVIWKQKFRFVKALELLQRYKNTSMVASRLGYKSDSAFITMFKKMSGGKLPKYFSCSKPPI
ncbi:MAG TPA: AraC family transcriptional regulator [Gammaproteobacteria bacterium]|nr:AraC family transcriptional regulator [Gammaproteobacteria bacterium]